MNGPRTLRVLLALASLWFLSGCSYLNEKPQPRLVMFVGVDISGSFLKGKYFDDSMDFLSNYIYAHLNGLGGMEVPSALFVGDLGGKRKGEPKSFFPIEVFQGKTPGEIKAKLEELVPRKEDPYSDFNSFLEDAADMVKDRRMVLKPISLVMISDGFVDMPGKNGGHIHEFKKVELLPLEKLSRNVTVRLLYTDATVGKKWESQIPRRRVKVWTQDADVMATWRDPKIFLADQPIEKQDKFFAWVKDNVDFGVRMKRVD